MAPPRDGPLVGLGLWSRLVWSKPLFGLLLLNLAWTASFFIAPFTMKPGTFAYQIGAANVIDHEDVWSTLWFYPRIVYTFGDFQCHQLWYRSLWLNGNQFPMCARMTSMYIFANFGLVAAAFATPSTSASTVMLNAMPNWIRKRLLRFGPERGAFLLVVLGLLPVAIDGFTQLFSDWTHYESTNPMRILTGATGGFVGGLLVGAMFIAVRQFTVEINATRARMSPPKA